MNAAAALLVGEHDFASFGVPPQGENSVRHVVRAEWTGDGAELCFDIEANAFLRPMVRTIVGTLLWVGSGRITPIEVGRILQARDRSQAAPPAPACGLCLVEVVY